jgi:2,3-bisphosphoglycerate-independent phosphoglycerate mutase
VPTYDHKPEMSAREAADAFIARGPRTRRASGSSTSPTPTWSATPARSPAAITGVRDVDACLADVVRTVLDSGGVCVVTADHGNADEMLEDDGSPDTAHSLNPVPFVVTSEDAALGGEGILADVAPTILALLGVEQPAAMTGRSLVA